ncbi:MAG: ribosome-associated translation inhibitor RaiA [Fimbriimonadaceae bacterium]|nr:ribosome-associated translation inhibitor RaiA [Fimbriimonadaceae bacterium]
MELLVRNAEGNLSLHDREYAAKKLSKLERHFSKAQKVEMVHREDKSGHTLEVTVFADGLMVRGEEHDESIQAAIDKLSSKLETRMRRLKGRIQDRHRSRGHYVAPSTGLEADLEEPAPPPFDIRRFPIKPMNREEAILEYELMDFPLFVFRNQDTNGIEVLYKRKNGRYGLMQPEG